MFMTILKRLKFAKGCKLSHWEILTDHGNKEALDYTEPGIKSVKLAFSKNLYTPKPKNISRTCEWASLNCRFGTIVGYLAYNRRYVFPFQLHIIFQLVFEN